MSENARLLGQKPVLQENCDDLSKAMLTSFLLYEQIEEKCEREKEILLWQEIECKTEIERLGDQIKFLSAKLTEKNKTLMEVKEGLFHFSSDKF